VTVGDPNPSQEVVVIETEWALRPEALLQAISEWTPSLEWPSSATNARVSATWPGIAPPCWRPNATVARESVTWHANALLRPQLVPMEEASNATSVERWATWRATAKLTEPKPGLEHKETRVIEKPSKDPFLFFIHIRGKKIQSYHHDIFIFYVSINRKISFLFVKSDLVLRSPSVIDLLFPTLFRFE